ncbi:hypothetical protein BH23GEM11_BH23GEM11_00580 [soil metagenome]
MSPRSLPLRAALVAMVGFSLVACQDDSIVSPAAPVADDAPAAFQLSVPMNPDPGVWGTLPSLDLVGMLKPVPTASFMTTTSSGGLSPELLEATLQAGESVTEEKVLTVTATPPAADILLVFDLTGSMGGALTQIKLGSVDIMNQLSGSIADVRFGFASYEDYPSAYGPAADNCGYSNTYGSAAAGDRPWRLDRALTTSTADVANAIQSAVLKSGSDAPEAYTRAFYEAYAELIGEENPDFGAIGWRSGARRFLVNWGDNVPHDCDVNGPIGLTRSTGKDPGRDGLINTGDDLEILPVLDGLRDNNITLINLFNSTNSTFNTLWSAYAERAEGIHLQINPNGTIPSGISVADQIEALVREASSLVRNVNLRVCAEDQAAYASWLTSVNPTSYTDVDVSGGNVDLDFDIEITVPVGTAAGLYEFSICGIGDGAEYGRQLVKITVEDDSDPVDPVDPVDPEFEGCSAGFWSNNGIRSGSWPAAYAPADRVDSVFSSAAGSLGSASLLQALEGYRHMRGARAGVAGASEILLRQAVAAVLNAESYGAMFPASVDDVVDSVNAALDAGDRAQILALAATLDEWNNAGCSLPR